MFYTHLVDLIKYIQKYTVEIYIKILPFFVTLVV